LLAEPEGFRQREPCPLAVIGAGVFLNVNDSLEPPGVHYGPCEPHLIRFAIDAPAPLPTPIMPDWRAQPRFTDHSYRGFAADPELERLLMLNIDAETSIQHWCYMTQRGEAIHTGAIEFPIRACYPQVALEPKTAHVLAVGDIVEPVAEWRGYKFEQTQRTWDYVFRALYYAWNPDVANEEFSAPIEIANVDATAGHISNQDLWIAPEGEAYVLYTERQVASSLMRDKFFPHGSTVNSLELAVIKNGGIATRRTVVEGTEAIQPGHARFHETADGRLFAVVYLTGPEAGNYLVQVYPESVPGKDRPDPIRIPVERPFSSYCLASVRAGCVASDIIDILGHAGTPNTLSYAHIVIK